MKSGGVEGWLENGACPVPIPEGEEEKKQEEILYGEAGPLKSGLLPEIHTRAPKQNFQDNNF